jgi:hypothetical protein
MSHEVRPLSSSEIRERATQRINGLANRGRDICPEFVTARSADVGCARCGYNPDLHLVRDLLALLASRETPRQEEEDLARIDSTRERAKGGATAGKDRSRFVRSSDELIREYAATRQHRDRLRRERAGLFCERAEPVTADDYRDAQAEAQSDPLAEFEFPQTTQPEACWKAARKWDDTRYRTRFYFDPPPSQWCESCRRRQSVNDAYRAAVRRHGGALRGLIARGKAVAKAREAGSASEAPTVPDGETQE